MTWVCNYFSIEIIWKEVCLQENGWNNFHTLYLNITLKVIMLLNEYERYDDFIPRMFEKMMKNHETCLVIFHSWSECEDIDQCKDNDHGFKLINLLSWS